MTCFVCGTADALEEHHLIEQARGGTEGKTVMLCANCHSNAHKLAKARTAKNPEVRNRTYGLPDHQDRLELVVKYIHVGRVAYRENQEYLTHHATSLVSVEVSPEQLRRLHRLRASQGFPSLDMLMRYTMARITGIRSWPKGSPPNSNPPRDNDPW